MGLGHNQTREKIKRKAEEVVDPAFREGRLAFLNGVAASDNPYRESNKEKAQVWYFGWEGARRSSEAPAGTKEDSASNTFGIILWVGIALVVGWGLYSVIYDKPEDEMIWLKDGRPALVEAKSFLGGVWFHKDFVKIGDDHFRIGKRSWTGRYQTALTIPYDRVKAVRFKDGLSGFKFIIENDGDHSFFINRKETLDTVRNLVQESGGNRFPIVIEMRVK